MQYSAMEDATHFLNALKTKYPGTVDMAVSTYIVIILDWDYKLRTTTLSMIDYVHKGPHKFGHILEVDP